MWGTVAIADRDIIPLLRTMIGEGVPIVVWSADVHEVCEGWPVFGVPIVADGFWPVFGAKLKEFKRCAVPCRSLFPQKFKPSNDRFMHKA